MTRDELQIKPGGLFRCCIYSAWEWVAEDPKAEAVEGETIPCKAEHEDTMIVGVGTIFWEGIKP